MRLGESPARGNAAGDGHGTDLFFFLCQCRRDWAPPILIPNTQPQSLSCSSSPNIFVMDQPQPLVIRLHPNAAVHERQDGVWFQSDSPVVFQHADISTMSELEAVFLYNLEGGFMENRKVGYRYLQRQPNGRFVHLLVWLFNDKHVRITFGCHRRLMPQHVMDFLVEVGRIPASLPVAATLVRIAEPPTPETETAMGHLEEDDSDYATSTASSYDAQEGGEGGAETRSASYSRYILPAPPPIPREEDMPCFFQQLDLDEGACSDPLKAGMGNDYNTDGGGGRDPSRLSDA
ncbi:hypothetical protein PIB30_066067 [Stylosanthes scabra]|uniref:Uncharacterized protein n=1 Tax=Stylosanthes scabra TaxID=79078 RepID=A0ABU6UPE0_9FABA|nr:hypothetical protein [Stylosanthes scabra]